MTLLLIPSVFPLIVLLIPEVPGIEVDAAGTYNTGLPMIELSAASLS
jgi:hypothetical protein